MKDTTKLIALVLTFAVAIGTGFGVGAWRTEQIKQNTETNEPIEAVETVAAPIEEKEIGQPERIYFDVPLSKEVQDTIFAECEKNNIDPALVVAIIERESDFDVETIGDGGRSVGLMQIMVKWHRERMAALNCENLLDPCQNVTVGIDYLAEQIDRYDGDVAKAVVAYNRGHFDGEFTDYAVFVLSRAVSLGGETECHV